LGYNRKKKKKERERENDRDRQPRIKVNSLSRLGMKSPLASWLSIYIFLSPLYKHHPTPPHQPPTYFIEKVFVDIWRNKKENKS
jgi:hypothetical protein